jgi:hypothetical protein
MLSSLVLDKAALVVMIQVVNQKSNDHRGNRREDVPGKSMAWVLF